MPSWRCQYRLDGIDTIETVSTSSWWYWCHWYGINNIRMMMITSRCYQCHLDSINQDGVNAFKMALIPSRQHQYHLNPLHFQPQARCGRLLWLLCWAVNMICHYITRGIADVNNKIDRRNILLFWRDMLCDGGHSRRQLIVNLSTATESERAFKSFTSKIFCLKLPR